MKTDIEEARNIARLFHESAEAIEKICDQEEVGDVKDEDVYITIGKLVSLLSEIKNL